MKKILVYKVEDNGNLDDTAKTLEDAGLIIKCWMGDIPPQQLADEENKLWFKITPIFMDTEEYYNFHGK